MSASLLTEQFAEHGVGHSEPFVRLLREAERLARIPRPILIRGERGTGKELIARYIHRCSHRSAYVVVNCAAFQEDLFVAEMFGREKGAYTGAVDARPGKLERADQGTLFLDEVANMNRIVQEKLLRVIEYQQFERLGGSRPISVDVRLIAATNADLEAMMKGGEFLPDLYDRLCFAELTIPPLRRRREDIPDLIRFFIDELHREIPDLEHKQFTPAAVEALQQYHWPGNIRQLKNIIERLYISDEDGTIHAAELPMEITAVEPIRGNFYEKVRAYEKNLLSTALKDCGGNQREAAERLGMTYDQFRHFYKKYRLEELLV